MKQLKTLGEEKIRAVVSDFYNEAWHDPMIGHFFFNFSKEKLITAQTAFLASLFGGVKRYHGRSLDLVHRRFRIKNVHFDRRQVILSQVLASHFDDPSLRDQWLASESGFRRLIVNDKENCRGF